MMRFAKVKRGPGRQGITYDEVAAAADSIRDEGRHPTYSEVRTRLGTGSPKKLGEHMQRWWSAQEIRPVAKMRYARNKATRDQLVKLKLPSVRAKALRNLASTLSKAPDLDYSREVTGWIIRAPGNESQHASSHHKATD